MSTLGGSRGERQAKPKFSALDINTLHRTSRGESLEPSTQKSAVPRKHGMQSLGKVPSARRPPANLPSLKAETLTPGDQSWAATGEGATSTATSTGGSGSGPITTGANSAAAPSTTASSHTNSGSAAAVAPIINTGLGATGAGQQQQLKPSGATLTGQAAGGQRQVAVGAGGDRQQQQQQQQLGNQSWSTVAMTGSGPESGGGAQPPLYQSPQFQHEFPSLDGNVPTGSGSSSKAAGGGPAMTNDMTNHHQQQGGNRSQQQDMQQMNMRSSVDGGNWQQGGSGNGTSGGGTGGSNVGPSPDQGLQQVPPQFRALMPPFMYRGNNNSGAGGGFGGSSGSGMGPSGGGGFHNNNNNSNMSNQSRPRPPPGAQSQHNYSDHGYNERGGNGPHPNYRGRGSGGPPRDHHHHRQMPFVEAEVALLQRPIIKEEELERIDSIAKDEGWCKYDEIDYNQKLNFSDDDDLEAEVLNAKDNKEQQRNQKNKDDEQQHGGSGAMRINGHRASGPAMVDPEVKERVQKRQEEEERRAFERKQAAAKKLQELESKMGQKKEQEEEEQPPRGSSMTRTPPKPAIDFRSMTQIGDGRSFMSRNTADKPRGDYGRYEAGKYDREMNSRERDRDYNASGPTRNIERSSGGGRGGGDISGPSSQTGAGQGQPQVERDRDGNVVFFSKQFLSNLPPRFQNAVGSGPSSSGSAPGQSTTGSTTGAPTSQPSSTQPASQSQFGNERRAGNYAGDRGVGIAPADKNIPFAQQYDIRYISSQGKQQQQQQQQVRRTIGGGQRQRIDSEEDDRFSGSGRESIGRSSKAVSSMAERKLSVSSEERNHPYERQESMSWSEDQSIETNKDTSVTSMISNKSEETIIKKDDGTAMSTSNMMVTVTNTVSTMSHAPKHILQRNQSITKSGGITEIKKESTDANDQRKSESPKLQLEHEQSEKIDSAEKVDHDSKTDNEDHMAKQQRDSSGMSKRQSPRTAPGSGSSGGRLDHVGSRGTGSGSGSLSGSRGGDSRGGSGYSSGGYRSGNQSSWNRQRGGGTGSRMGSGSGHHHGGRYYNEYGTDSEGEGEEYDDEYGRRMGYKRDGGKSHQHERGQQPGSQSVQQKEGFAPRGEPSRRGRGGSASAASSSSSNSMFVRRGGSSVSATSTLAPPKRIDNYGPPGSKSPFGGPGDKYQADGKSKSNLEKASGKVGSRESRPYQSKTSTSEDSTKESTNVKDEKAATGSKTFGKATESQSGDSSAVGTGAKEATKKDDYQQAPPPGLQRSGSGLSSRSGSGISNQSSSKYNATGVKETDGKDRRDHKSSKATAPGDQHRTKLSSSENRDRTVKESRSGSSTTSMQSNMMRQNSIPGRGNKHREEAGSFNNAAAAAAWEKSGTGSEKNDTALDADNMLNRHLSNSVNSNEKLLAAEKALLDGSAPVSTIIFENTNYKQVPAPIKRQGSNSVVSSNMMMDSKKEEQLFKGGDTMDDASNISSALSKISFQHTNKDQDYDFTFETEISQLTDDTGKATMNQTGSSGNSGQKMSSVNVPVNSSTNVHNVAAAVSAAGNVSVSSNNNNNQGMPLYMPRSTVSQNNAVSTADLNMKIASVKKVWENAPYLAPVLEQPSPDDQQSHLSSNFVGGSQQHPNAHQMQHHFVTHNHAAAAAAAAQAAATMSHVQHAYSGGYDPLEQHFGKPNQMVGDGSSGTGVGGGAGSDVDGYHPSPSPQHSVGGHNQGLKHQQQHDALGGNAKMKSNQVGSGGPLQQQQLQSGLTGHSPPPSMAQQQQQNSLQSAPQPSFYPPASAQTPYGGMSTIPSPPAATVLFNSSPAPGIYTPFQLEPSRSQFSQFPGHYAAGNAAGNAAAVAAQYSYMQSAAGPNIPPTVTPDMYQSISSQYRMGQSPFNQQPQPQQQQQQQAQQQNNQSAVLISSSGNSGGAGLMGGGGGAGSVKQQQSLQSSQQIGAIGSKAGSVVSQQQQQQQQQQQAYSQQYMGIYPSGPTGPPPQLQNNSYYSNSAGAGQGPYYGNPATQNYNVQTTGMFGGHGGPVGGPPTSGPPPPQQPVANFGSQFLNITAATLNQYRGGPTSMAPYMNSKQQQPQQQQQQQPGHMQDPNRRNEFDYFTKNFKDLPKRHQ